MLKSTLLCIILISLISGTASSQGWGSVTGEGPVVKKQLLLDAIDGISLGFSGKVVLTPGSKQQIIVEGQQNIIDLIKREVKDGVWKIDFSKSVHNAKEVTVYVTVPDLKLVALSGSGSMISNGNFANLDEVDVVVSGSGNIKFESVAKDMDVKLSGSGNIELKGIVKSLDIAVSGSGDVSASDLKSSKCEIHISGSGDVDVQVNGDLETTISGSGDVRYKGEANVKANIVGSGSVSKL